MPTIQEQFSFQVLPNHFERDTHLGIQGLNIEKIHILSGESPNEDVLVVLNGLLLHFGEYWSRFSQNNPNLGDAEGIIKNLVKGVDGNTLAFSSYSGELGGRGENGSIVECCGKR